LTIHIRDVPQKKIEVTIERLAWLREGAISTPNEEDLVIAIAALHAWVNDPKCASNVALVEMLQLPTVAQRFHSCLVSYIQKYGLTFTERDLISAVTREIVDTVLKEQKTNGP
jgi:hypothetical protein